MLESIASMQLKICSQGIQAVCHWTKHVCGLAHPECSCRGRCIRLSNVFAAKFAASRFFLKKKKSGKDEHSYSSILKAIPTTKAKKKRKNCIFWYKRINILLIQHFVFHSRQSHIHHCHEKWFVRELQITKMYFGHASIILERFTYRMKVVASWYTEIHIYVVLFKPYIGIVNTIQQAGSKGSINSMSTNAIHNRVREASWLILHCCCISFSLSPTHPSLNSECQ